MTKTEQRIAEGVSWLDAQRLNRLLFNAYGIDTRFVIQGHADTEFWYCLEPKEKRLTNDQFRNAKAFSDGVLAALKSF